MIKTAIIIVALSFPILFATPQAFGDEGTNGQGVKSSYSPVVIETPFSQTMANDKAVKDKMMKRHMDLLEERYDLGKHVTTEVTMPRGKPIPVGPAARLKPGMTWEKLSSMTPEEIKEQGIFPMGYMPLPHPIQDTGGMVFPKSTIDEVKKQTGRDLARFDMDFDLPDQFMPEFPPAIYLTTRPDLGDVSQGKLVTLDNYFEIFNGILNPKQLEGLRLLVTPFPQQQFNATDDRKCEKPSLGVACFDCHVNGHTNGATHLVGDIRPQDHRHRIETPSLRGVNIQRLFGSQRALKSVEDFTEFEQRAAYFDGDPVIATKKGVNILERGSQVHFMAEMQEILDFPPAPKLNIYGMLDPKRRRSPRCGARSSLWGRRNVPCATPPRTIPTTPCTTFRWSGSTRRKRTRG